VYFTSFLITSPETATTAAAAGVLPGAEADAAVAVVAGVAAAEDAADKKTKKQI
jgi:hypothetical protein